MEDDHRRKTTSKYEKLNISTTTGRILLKFETEAMRLNKRVSNEDNLQWKTTSKYGMEYLSNHRSDLTQI